MPTCIIDTPLGLAQLSGNTEGLSSLNLLDTEHEISLEIPEELKEGVRQINEYFNSERKAFNLKLNPEGTEFQENVWRALLEIPFGKTTSYLELSRRLGDLKAIRAVANANAKNPLWIIIPCHRVIGSDGSLTGYAGGLHRKEWLLRHEGAIKQQSLF